MQTGCRPLLSPLADKGKRKGNKKSASEIQNILNIKSGENKKKPLDSEESRVNLMAEDEGSDYQKGALAVKPANGNSPPGCCI